MTCSHPIWNFWPKWYHAHMPQWNLLHIAGSHFWNLPHMVPVVLFQSLSPCRLRSHAVLQAMLDMNLPLPKLSPDLLHLKNLKLPYLTGLKMTVWTHFISSLRQARVTGQHHPESSPGPCGLPTQSQVWRRKRRWSQSIYACFLIPVFFPLMLCENENGWAQHFLTAK